MLLIIGTNTRKPKKLSNVRELENIVRRMVVSQNNSHLSVNLPADYKLKKLVAKAEKEIIRQMVLLCGGDRTKAARKLGIGRTTL